MATTNAFGTVTFATSGKDSRTSQLFVNTARAGNGLLDGQGFAPFATVVGGGMDAAVLRVNHEYGERPSQGQIRQQGNKYLGASFPRLSYIVDVKRVGGEIRVGGGGGSGGNGGGGGGSSGGSSGSSGGSSGDAERHSRDKERDAKRLEEEAVREAIAEDPPEERGVREEWETGEGWHERYDARPTAIARPGKERERKRKGRAGRGGEKGGEKEGEKGGDEEGEKGGEKEAEQRKSKKEGQEQGRFSLPSFPLKPYFPESNGSPSAAQLS